MLRIELSVDSDNCIETVAKREYDSYIGKYFEEESEELGERINLLYKFLTSVDFRELRRESEPYIMEGKNVKFVIYPEGKKAKYQLEVK